MGEKEKEKVSLPYLRKLVGKMVTVFKGGPNSRTGVLVEVKKDFLVLQTKDEGFVYYPFAQLKSIIENTKHSADKKMDATSENEIVSTFPNTFHELVASLQMNTILVNGGGPASAKGFLIDVKPEFIVLSTEKDGLLFFRLDQVKSISGKAIEQKTELPEITFGGSQSFADLLGLHLYNWTTFNGGPDRVEGVLVEVNKTYSVLVKHEEVVYVPNDSIHFIAQKVNSNNDGEDNSEQSNGKSNSSNVKRMLIENLTRATMTRNEN